MSHHVLLKVVIMIRRSPAIRGIPSKTKGIKLDPYRLNNVPAKLWFNCPAAVLQSSIVTRVIRAV